MLAGLQQEVAERRRGLLETPSVSVPVGPPWGQGHRIAPPAHQGTCVDPPGPYPASPHGAPAAWAGAPAYLCPRRGGPSNGTQRGCPRWPTLAGCEVSFRPSDATHARPYPAARSSCPWRRGYFYQSHWGLDTDSSKQLINERLRGTRAEPLAAESKPEKLGKIGKTDTDKFVFNKGVNFLSILYKTIAIKNFIFESKIFTYEQVTVQNLHEKMERQGFPKRQNKRRNSFQVLIKILTSTRFTLARSRVRREGSHGESQGIYSHKSTINRQFNTITSENIKNQLVYL